MKPIKRAVHFDFHTMPGIDNFGENFDAEVFAQQLADAKVEYVNMFGQCNIGFCYYDTKVGIRYPNMKGDMLREGKILAIDGTYHAGIDIVLNNFDAEGILAQLPALAERESLRVMIHEQYFYEEYENYQPDFEEKLYKTFAALKAAGRESRFFEELIG